MKTVIDFLLSIPEPYRSEVLSNRIKGKDSVNATNLQGAIMIALPICNVRNIVLKAYNRGELKPKPEPRPEMAMPERSSTVSEIGAIPNCQYGIFYNNYSSTDSDKFTEQFQPLGTHINHNEYLN